ncbi:MAG: type II and III secretion system protein [Acidobacteriota bacterium]|nr:type II and III secretion system protein [Acidobacteriota bacterium]
MKAGVRSLLILRAFTFCLGLACLYGQGVPEPPVVGTITDNELAQTRKLLPPPHLRAASGRKDLDLHGDARSLFEQVAKAFDLLVVFDSAYQPKSGLRFKLEQADYREALEALQAATESFVIPAAEKLMLVANDTPQKRTELERNEAIVIPVPEPFALQEVQEIATAVRGTLDIQRMMVDSQRRLILVRDRASKVIMAEKLIRDLMQPKPQVAIEVELLASDQSSSLTYGLSLPTSFPLVWVPTGERNLTSMFPSGFTNFFGFGGGHSHLALGITNASLFANATKSFSTTLLKSEVVTSDGQAASLHVGDKYPIVTSGYFGAGAGSSQAFAPPPSINFEDLGLILKITPHVHGIDDMTLEIEAEFKLLGTSSINEIPTIRNRKFQSKVDVANGEWAVLAGLVTESEASTITGIPGLAKIPVLRHNQRSRDRGETVIVLKPHLLNLPPTETLMRAAWVGTETRPRTQL